MAAPFASASSSSMPKSGKEEQHSPKMQQVSLSPKSSRASQASTSSKSSFAMPPSPSPSMQASMDRATELPYMGEITLDSKPRRGRKPKKADICHLIYKNYGTVFPSPKKNLSETPSTTAENKPKISWAKDGEDKIDIFQSSLAWNKASGSLLEKRLTGSTNLGERVSVSNGAQANNNNFQNGSCDKMSKTKSNLRDYCLTNRKEAAEALKRAASKPLNSVPNGGSINGPRDPSLAQACVQRLLAYAAGLEEQSEPLNLCTRDQLKVEPSSGSDSEPEELTKLPPGVSPIETSQPGGYVFWPSAGVFVHPQLLYKPPSPVPPTLVATSPRLVKKKRKRSAIFIPPAESPTEVSICKFKFTGGAKPSLEEKKMLSVDAGGNFRFYSGTDKGMRSFLPHLQHPPPILPSQNSPLTPLHKINLSPTDDNFSLQSSPSPASSSLPLDHPSMHISSPSPQDRLSNSKRKRRSRKSEVREKLEQTFKEKGFLIQTQQLESAEGATYCKFRQLRKFTRYLFRSWRDYLPHSIQDLTQANQQQLQGTSSSLGEPPENLDSPPS
jgi:hypothetical protein